VLISGSLNTATGAMIMSGANVIAHAAGTVSAPSIYANGDTNTGIFFPAADTIAFAEGGAEAMRIDSDGDVGIGTTSPAQKLHLAATTAAINLQITNDAVTTYLGQGGTGSTTTDLQTNVALRFNTGASYTERMRIDSSGNVGIGTTGYGTYATTRKAISLGEGATISAAASGGDPYITIASNAYFTSTPDWKYVASDFASMYEQYNGTHVWQTAASGTAGNAITFTERARITSGGNFLLGTTNSSVEASPGFKYVASTIEPYIGIVVNAPSALTNYHYYNTNATNNGYRFYVGVNGTVYAISTTISAISDQRLKENIRDLDVGLDAVMALKPRKFDWKEGKGQNTKDCRGFIAQEFEEIFPDLIDEWKDPAPEGEEPYKSVRADLIPILVKAIQELKAELDTVKAQNAAFEARLAALEAK
jgi:hypothetical protein